MKKSLVALAVLAAAGAASAQSSVTLFGIVDATYQIGKGSTANVTRLGNSGLSSSQLGFRGTEDLGGGMKAGFWLEAALQNDNGQGGNTNSNNQTSGAPSVATPVVAGSQGLVFARRSTVSVGGNWGEVRLGRDYTPHFWNHTVYDPFGTNGVGTSITLVGAGSAYPTATGGTAVRASNSITYLYNHGFNATYAAGNAGLHAALQLYMGEVASNAATAKDGNGMSLRVGYNAGPISVAFANGSTKFSATGKITTNNLGGSYDLGVAKLIANWNTDKNALSGAKQTGTLIGATAPVGVGLIRASYSTTKSSAANSSSKQLALGYVHNLSKRSALYATYARVTNQSGVARALNGATTAAGNSSTGYDFGVRHTF